MSAFSETDRLDARVSELESMNNNQSRDLHDLAKRLAEAEADRDDYEQRWLAECRAHGETQRELAALRAQAPLPCETCGRAECACLDSSD